MDLAGLRDALHRQPFEPFVIRLADGRSAAVPHPDFLAVGKRRAILIQEDDSCLWLEPLLVVSIDWPSAAGKGKSGNGTPKKRRPGA
jgi:hypothetical protein